MSDLTLAGFLAARLGEDERIAREAYADGPGAGMISVPHATGALIARHDPARVLREVEAGRTLLRYFTDPQTHEPLSVAIAPDAYALGRGEGITLPGSWILRELAAVYSDHPDYREEWKP